MEAAARCQESEDFHWSLHPTRRNLHWSLHPTRTSHSPQPPLAAPPDATTTPAVDTARRHIARHGGLHMPGLRRSSPDEPKPDEPSSLDRFPPESRTAGPQRQGRFGEKLLPCFLGLPLDGRKPTAPPDGVEATRRRDAVHLLHLLLVLSWVQLRVAVRQGLLVLQLREDLRARVAFL